jgi:nitroimidazol reductase NimA-like FMN-containing flavoprotein (pyridoxamine 5'-phosphate oxidase superfamily)
LCADALACPSHDEIDALLRSERIVRMAFAEGEPYVVPLGYVWVESALWGTTRRGRKTRMAESQPRVAFTVDDSSQAIPFAWRSVVGAGHFELVGVETFETARSRMAEAFPDNPEWNAREWIEGLADGTSVCWRVRPTELTGRVPDPT